MISAIQQKHWTFTEFYGQYRDDNRYELIDGEVFDLEPTGAHEEVAAFLVGASLCDSTYRKLNVQIDNLDLPYLVLQQGLVKLPSGFTSFRPDIMVVDARVLDKDPLWSQESIITLGSSIQFVAEVVSSNWQNDYARKVEDYALLGIPEYWIVDYAALGGVDFIGRPKQFTLTICLLDSDGSYEKFRLRGEERVTSKFFPELSLTASQILTANRRSQ